MYTIDLQSRTPIYEQLCKRITELILKGELKPNDKIPSVRELAKGLGVNPNTVSKAFGILERDGIIYSLAGRGSFVAEIKQDSLKEKAFADFDKAVDEALKAGITCEELAERIRGKEESL
ncbi:MAG: GntR family transcriptional regulator [Oscillospiraceae bacterium]|nr:GntR family transcriptional regulator [Oscillospiraceae bacterium]